MNSQINCRRCAEVNGRFVQFFSRSAKIATVRPHSRFKAEYRTDFSFSLVTRRWKRPNATSDVGKTSEKRSMIDFESHPQQCSLRSLGMPRDVFSISSSKTCKRQQVTGTPAPPSSTTGVDIIPRRRQASLRLIERPCHDEKFRNRTVLFRDVPA
jgi:hypothetical protein